MKVHAVLLLTLAAFIATGCSDEIASPEAAPGERLTASSTPAMAKSQGSNGALVERHLNPFKLGPRGPVPITAPCLSDIVDEQPVIGGIVLFRSQRLETPSGRIHLNEYGDYSDVRITAGDLTWLPGTNAREKFVILLDEGGVRNFARQFHARYVSQDGLPDLRVSHRVHRTIGPDGTIRHFKRTPSFSAKCLGA